MEVVVTTGDDQNLIPRRLTSTSNDEVKEDVVQDQWTTNEFGWGSTTDITYETLEPSRDRIANLSAFEKFAEKIGLSAELSELRDALRNIESLWPERDPEFEEEVKRLAWVEETLREEWYAQYRRRNIRQQCRELCSTVLRRNQLFCLCFCGRHRELCPAHRVVEPVMWKSEEMRGTSRDRNNSSSPPGHREFKNTVKFSIDATEEEPSLEQELPSNTDQLGGAIVVTRSRNRKSPSISKEKLVKGRTQKPSLSPHTRPPVEEACQAECRTASETRRGSPRAISDIKFKSIEASQKGVCFGCGRIGHMERLCQNRKEVLTVKRKHWEHRRKLLLSNPDESSNWFRVIGKIVEDEKPISEEHKVRIAGQYLKGCVKAWYDQFLRSRIKSPVGTQPDIVKKAFTDLEGLKEVMQQAFRTKHKEPPRGPRHSSRERVNPTFAH